MATPSYTTDLTTFNDATSNTGWGEFTNMTLGGGPDIDTDLAIHGSVCITQDRAKVGLCSQGYDGNAVTIATGECFFIWTKFFAPNSLDSLAAGGQRVVVGSSLAAWDAWYMDGDDTYDYGGWKNYAVDPTFAADASNGTVTTYNACGNGWLLTAAPSKGNPFNTDIIRYGRGESIFTGGESADYATFSGYAVVNDNPTTGRFGLIQAEGLGYLYKGLMSLGTSGTAVDMRDSNTSITIDDTTKVLSTFNRIEVNNASSNVEWTSISFGALGTVSKGQFEAIDNATIVKTGCTFTDMDTFIYQSNSDLLSTTYRRCGLVTQGGATFTNSLFEAATTTALSVDDLSLVTKCTFSSSGTGHAVDLGTIASTQSMTWDNTESGYAATNGTTGNETIKVSVNTGITLTINVSSTGSTPTIYNAGVGTVNVVAGAITLKMIVKDTSQQVVVGAYAYIDDANTAPYILNTTTDVNGEASVSYSDGAVTGTTWRIRKYGYKPFVQTVDISGSDIILPVTLITDPQQT